MDNKDMLQEEKDYLGILDTPEDVKKDSPESAVEATEETAETEAEAPDSEESDVIEDSGDKKVPLKALSEERKEKRQYKERAIELEKQVAVANDRVSQLQEKLEKLISALTNPQDQEEEFSEDPISRVDRLERQIQESKKQKEIETAQNQIAAKCAESVNEFIKKVPDYLDAYNHLLSSRAEELRELGFSDHDVRLKLGQDEFNIAVTALQQGKDPAQVAYNLAVRRGYRKKERKQAEAPITLANTRGAPSKISKKEMTVRDMSEMDDESFRKMMLGE